MQRARSPQSGTETPQAGLAGDQTDTSREVVFLGLVATDAEALRFTVAIFTGKDYFYIDSDTDEVKLLDNATFTAPDRQLTTTSTADSWWWRWPAAPTQTIM